jgi:hypothetical protein
MSTALTESESVLSHYIANALDQREKVVGEAMLLPLMKRLLIFNGATVWNLSVSTPNHQEVYNKVGFADSRVPFLSPIAPLEDIFYYPKSVKREWGNDLIIAISSLYFVRDPESSSTHRHLVMLESDPSNRYAEAEGFPGFVGHISLISAVLKLGDYLILDIDQRYKIIFVQGVSSAIWRENLTNLASNPETYHLNHPDIRNQLHHGHGRIHLPDSNSEFPKLVHFSRNTAEIIGENK